MRPHPLRVIAIVVCGAIASMRGSSAADDNAVPLAMLSAPAIADLRAEVEWSSAMPGARMRAQGEVRAWRGLTLLAGAEVDPARDSARPSVGVAYQVVPPAPSIGLRAQLSYRPEGFVQPEGEIEASLAVARLSEVVRGAITLTYGQDPEGDERDVEGLATCYVVPAPRFSTGALARVRRQLGARLEQGLTWDLVAGGFVGLHQAPYVLELLGGFHHLAEPDAQRDGLVLVFSAGAAW